MMRMLTAAAMFAPEPITPNRMAAIAQMSPSSGSFGTYLATLKRDGLITSEGNLFRITDAGVKSIGKIEPLPTGDALIEMWCGILGSGSGTARILRHLAKIYPHIIPKTELGDATGTSFGSGSFGTYLATLKRNGLISGVKGQFKAADELF